MSSKPRLTVVPSNPADPIAAAVSAEPAMFDINMSEVLHLTGGSAANGDKNDPVVLQGSAEAQMRRVIGEFGFDRLPLTLGELHGLLDYCLRLDSIAGNHMPAKSRESWKETSLEVCAEYEPAHLEAAKLYCAGDKEGLLRLHRERDTLKQLGRDWKQFEGE
jgi:hypothetical protein